MDMEGSIKRLETVSSAPWQSVPVKTPKLSESDRASITSKLERGLRFATKGDECAFRVVRHGVAYMVRAKLLSVRRLDAPRGGR